LTMVSLLGWQEENSPPRNLRPRNRMKRRPLLLESKPSAGAFPPTQEML
jgi:hypothetical protein